MSAFLLILTVLLIQYGVCVEFITECSTHLIDEHYGYNISCRFNITTLNDTIHHVSLNWSLPSQTSFIFDNATYFIGGENAANRYKKSSLIATWNKINASSSAILILYLQPNTSITLNEIVISTASIQYYNISNISLYSPSIISKSVMIEFSVPSNDGPSIYASSYSLTTNEDTAVSTNVYVTDPDFYELSSDGLMRVNISVINGTISLSSELGGIYFLKGNDTNSSDIHMVGSLHSVNESLNIITFNPRKNRFGNGQIIISITDQGNTGTGPPKTASIAINISIIPIFEIPNLIAPAATIIINEDTNFNLAQINCTVTTDVDPEYGWLQLTISTIYGNFSFHGGTTGMNINFGSHSITINDTAQLLSSYFENITYYTLENFNEESYDVDTIFLTLLDHAGLTQIKQFDVLIESVNDAPIINVVTSFETNEDTAKAITINIDDVDFDTTWGATFIVILKVSNGTLSLKSRKGLYILSGSWKSSQIIHFKASKTNTNNALNPITYIASLNYFGNDRLEIFVSDQGNTGQYGGIQWTNLTVSIVVNETNGDDLVPIINGFDAAIVCHEDIECYMNNVSITIANIAKSDKTNFTVKIKVTDNMGYVSMNANSLNMVEFSIGNGTMDTIVEFKGNYTNINGVFNNFSFLSTLNNQGYQGYIKINVSNDFGDNSLMNKHLYIYAINDAPVINLPYSSITIDEDNKLQIVGITIQDVDVNDTWYGHLYCYISCLHGSIRLHSIEGIQFINSTTDESNNINMFSRAGLIEIAIETIEYTPDAHYFGSDIITIYINDDGNTGIGGILSDTKTINITINNVLDPPFPTCPYWSLFAVEDTPIQIEGITLIDTDNHTNPLFIRFTLNHGIINISSYRVETIYSVDESVDSYSWQGLINASYVTISNIIGNITYYPVLNYNKVCCGHELLLITASYNSTFDTLIAECEIDIYVSSVNDPPTISVDTLQNVMEDDILSLGIEVNDLDITETPGGTFHVSLYAQNGIIDCDFYAGSWAKNGSVGTEYVQIIGSTPHVMDTVRTCTFEPDADFSGNTTVLVKAWDNGQSGAIGNAEMVTKSITINVTSVADAPRIFMNYPNYTSTYQLFIDEDTNLTMNFTVWEVDKSPYYQYLNGSTFTFNTMYGRIYAKDFNPLNWDTINNNGVLTAQCINCSFSHDTVSIEYEPNLHANSREYNNETIVINTRDIDGTITNFYYYMTVNPINDAVIVTCPLNIVSGYEDMPIEFNWTVHDPDANEGDGFLWISIVSINGTFWFDVNKTPFLIQKEGDITGNSSILRGETSLEGAQMILRDLRFMSITNYFGNASISVSINDQGNYGDGTNYWSNCTQHIVLYPVNDALSFSDSLNYTVDIAEDIESFIYGMSLIDFDATNDYIYTIIITFDSERSNISFPYNPHQILSVSANKQMYTANNLNYSTTQLLVNNISIFPTANYNGYIEMIVEITSNDTSQTNQQYAISKAHIIHMLHVHGVNDPPMISATLSLTINEDDCGYIQINITDLDFNEEYYGYMTGALMTTNCTFSIHNFYGLNYVEGEPLDSSFFEFHCASLDVINTALSQIEICSGIANFYGDASVYFNISDNGYSHGDMKVNGVSDIPLSDEITIPITINPVIDLVVITMNTQYNGLEDTLLPFVINISTFDIIKPNLSITINSDYGNISIINITESSLHSLQFTGDWTSCQEALANLIYDPDLNWNGYDDNLFISVNVTSVGKITSKTSTVYIEAVNDPIIISQTAIYSNYSVWEDESLRIDGISISDLDAMDDSRQLITAKINCSNNGEISLSTFEGLQFIQGNGTFDTMIEIYGGFEHINKALGLIRFYPGSDWYGNTNINVFVSDEGFTGSGPIYTDSIIIPITVISTPDAPIFNIGSHSICNEDGIAYFVGGSVYDKDSNNFQIEISVNFGVLTLNSTLGLSFKIGNGTNNELMTFNGSAINVNNAISNISYQPNTHWNGHDTVIVTCTDFDTAMLSHELDIEVIAVNDAPDIIIEINSFNALDSVPVSIRGVTISDIDFYESFHELCELNISAENGTVNLGAMESVNRLSNSGNIFLLTDLNNMNDALLHLMYVSIPYFQGIDIISITFSDLGNSGIIGGILTDTETINVTVSGINHAPLLTKTDSLIQMNEDQVANFSLTVYDEDCLNIECNLTLIVESNKGSIKSTNCLYLTSNLWAQQIIINGNVSQINLCATDIILMMTANWNGLLSHEIEISLNDNGYYGAGHPFYMTDIIGVNISSVNDELSIFSTISSTLYIVSRGYSVPLNGLQILDIDLNDTNTELLLVNISVNHNKISLYALNGLHFLNMDDGINNRFTRTTRYSQLDFYGTIYSINQALPYLYYHSKNTSYCGLDIIQIQVSHAIQAVNISLKVNVTCD